MGFDARRYTVDGLVKELLLLELHIRDGSVYECGCAWDAHLPLIEGLAQEGIKFAKDEKEKELFDRLMHLARDARLKLQYGLEGNGMEIEEEGSALTVESLRREGRLIEGKSEKGIYKKDEMFYVVKDDSIIWSGRQEGIARSVFEERDPIERAGFFVARAVEKPRKLKYVIRTEKVGDVFFETKEEAEKWKELAEAPEPIEELPNPVGEKRVGVRYIHEEVKPPEYFDPRSFRTVVRDEHRVVIACKLGNWSEDEALCQRVAKRPAPCCLIGTETQKILHPIEEK